MAAVSYSRMVTQQWLQRNSLHLSSQAVTSSFVWRRIRCRSAANNNFFRSRISLIRHSCNSQRSRWCCRVLWRRLQPCQINRLERHRLDLHSTISISSQWARIKQMRRSAWSRARQSISWQSTPRKNPWRPTTLVCGNVSSRRGRANLKLSKRLHSLPARSS